MSTSFLSILGRLTAVALLVIGLVALLATPAEATTSKYAVATPANDGAHPWSTDGCSASPERGPGWDFHHGCVHHDGCYRGHWSGRRTCDDRFHRDLRASCRVLHPSGGFGRWACEVLAAAYYSAVRAFGAPAYAAHLVTAAVR